VSEWVGECKKPSAMYNFQFKTLTVGLRVSFGNSKMAKEYCGKGDKDKDAYISQQKARPGV